MIRGKNQRIIQSKALHKQAGISLIFFALILVIAGTAAIFSYLDSGAIKNERDKKTANVLADAKTALIGYVSKSPDISLLNHLPNPDLRVNSTFSEGIQAGLVGPVNASLVGKFPWRSLGMPSIKDGYEECIWYAVSGNFKSNPASSAVFNWDTKGQIDVIDSSATQLHTNLAAILVSVGPPLSGQSRLNADVGLTECKGNYDARNYLDTYSLENAISGELNYFADSTNNRQASDASNKRFVLAQNQYYNDRILAITVDELFKPIIKRTDFSASIFALMNDADFVSHVNDSSLAIAGTKGTNSINCSLAPNLSFCNSWKEMLLLTELPIPSTITIDGLETATVCDRVLVFSGQKTSTQTRVTDTEKSNPANYLEGSNLSSFNTPIASDSEFNGLSVFDPENPSADVVKCLQDE